MMRPLLELGRFHSDWDANEKDAEHGNGSVALPVFGPAIWASSHAPHLRPEIFAVAVIHSSHAFSSPFPLFSLSDPSLECPLIYFFDWFSVLGFIALNCFHSHCIRFDNPFVVF